MTELEKIINTTFREHPFSKIPEDCDYENLLANYLAMSIAFPYIQAGSQKEIFFHFMEKNMDIPEDVELTTVVGNFLCWDETGGLQATISQGMKGLPKILDTRRFHANLLKNDCAKLLKKNISPQFTAVTKKYLIELYEGLSSLSKITRTAFMVSFESHAEQMIKALWKSLSERFGIDKQKLTYFMLHVGGTDPAEPYHVEMTKSLINKIAGDREAEFILEFEKAYSLHYFWCKNIMRADCYQFLNKDILNEKTNTIN